MILTGENGGTPRKTRHNATLCNKNPTWTGLISFMAQGKIIRNILYGNDTRTKEGWKEGQRERNNE